VVILLLVFFSLLAFQQAETAVAGAIALAAALAVVLGLEGIATATRLALAELDQLSSRSEAADTAPRSDEQAAFPRWLLDAEVRR
jgi:hypothetical protein